MLLDIRNSGLFFRERAFQANQSGEEVMSHSEPKELDILDVEAFDTGEMTVHCDVEAPSGKPVVSLQEMMNISVALKSDLDIEIVDTMLIWPRTLFPLDSLTSAPTRIALPGVADSDNDDIPPHIAEAISGLQRQVLLLKNELNFELWLTRENVKRIGRLYEQRILSRNAEVERQGLVSLSSDSCQCPC